MLDQSLEAALARLGAGPRVLLTLDFDGVLAPIVSDPAQARMLPGSADALQALGRRSGVQLALVSGRSLADLRVVAQAPPGTVLVGSHGAEIQHPAGAHVQAGEDTGLALLAPEAARLLLRLSDALVGISAAHEGTRVELKPSGAVLHTRQADRAVARQATLEAIDGPATWAGVHVTCGKEVVELSVVGATKGTAVQRLRDWAGLPSGRGGVLFVGDDVTDERAFAVLDDDTGDVTVKVGLGPTRARHRLAGPPEVVLLLQRLLHNR